MTDFDKFTDMFDSVGLGWNSDVSESRVEKYVTTGVGDNKVVGYGVSYARYEFDLNGKFIRLVCAE